MNPSRLVLVAGGTGGHIFPALSFGRWIKEQYPATQLCYVCGNRPMERDIYSSFNIDPRVLPVCGSPQGLRGLAGVRRWKDLLLATVSSFRLLIKAKPDAICLFGSYVSLPIMVAAKIIGIHQIIHEQNARAGRVTSMAKKWGIPVASGWPLCDPFEKGGAFFTGVPIRSVERLHRDEAWHKLVPGCSCPSGRVLLVLGGSLGSERLGALAESLSLAPPFRDWLIIEVGTVEKEIWQGERFLRLPRRWDMTPLFSLADRALCRGGASTLWELLIWGIPALVVPWREARDDHQLANARCFELLGGGALLLEDDLHRSEDILHLLEALMAKPFRRNDEGKSPPPAADGNCQSLWRVLTDAH